MAGVKRIDSTYDAFHPRLPDDQSIPHDEHREPYPMTFSVLTPSESPRKEMSGMEASA